MKENWGLLGHQWAVELLKGHLRNHASRHAYLFTGPSGVGRRTLALRFAQALNAEDGNETGEFDPQARTSQQFEQMTHPDLSLIRRLEGDRDIKIDAVREIQRSLVLAPYTAKYRIALLLNFEDANENAQNALLKTLEEPGPRVILMVLPKALKVCCLPFPPAARYSVSGRSPSILSPPGWKNNGAYLNKMPTSWPTYLGAGRAMPSTCSKIRSSLPNALPGWTTAAN